MVSSIVWPVCGGFPASRTDRLRCLVDTQGGGRLGAQLWESKLRTWTLNWDVTDYTTLYVLDKVWADSGFGVLPVAFAPPDGSGTLDVEILAKHAVTHVGPRAIKVSVSLREVRV